MHFWQVLIAVVVFVIFNRLYFTYKYRELITDLSRERDTTKLLRASNQSRALELAIMRPVVQAAVHWQQQTLLPSVTSPSAQMLWSMTSEYQRNKGAGSP